MDPILTADQCAAATQIIPLVIVAILAERRWFTPRNLFVGAKVTTAIALLWLAGAEMIAFFGIDGGLTNGVGALVVTVGALGGVAHVAGAIVADLFIPSD